MQLRRPERFRRLPSAVLFDLDNTLYPYDPAHQAGSAAVARKASRVLGAPEADLSAYFDQARGDVKARLGKVGAAHSRLLYFHRFLELAGMKSQPLLSLDLEQTYWRTFLSSARLFPGVSDFLDDLRSLGVPTGLVTDLTTQIQFRKLIYFGLEHAFDYVVTSEEAGADKPDSAPFLLIRDKMGLRDQLVWMIGDNASSDIEGAAEHLDAVTLHRCDDRAKPCPSADAVFHEFEDLRRLLHSQPAGATADAPAAG